MWRKSWKLKEEALCTRFVKNSEMLQQRARELRPLYVGSRCLLRNHSGAYPRKWDRSGPMDVLPHYQYVIIIDGLRRLTRRNRGFLRLYNPMSTSIDTKAFYGSCGNLPSPREGSVDHECPDSLDDFCEHSNSTNTDKPSEVKKSTFLFLWSQQKIMCHLPYVG